MIGRDRLLETMTAALPEVEGDQAELVALGGRRGLSRCANSTVHQNVSTEDVVTVARVVRGKRVGCASTHGADPEHFSRVLTRAAEVAQFVPEDNHFGGLPGPAPVPEIRCHVPETAALGPAERVVTLAQVFAAAKQHRMSVAGAFASREEELAVANSKGLAAYAPLTSASINLVVMGENSSGYACWAGRDIRGLDVETLAETAIRKCGEGQHPLEVEPGEYEVVLEPPALAELLEWMTYTCFGARSIKDKSSALAGRLGRKIVGDNVTLYDDATDPAGMPTPFDFEGVPKHRLDIIREGVAAGFGVDSMWAGRLHTQPTGHAWLKNSEDADPAPMNLHLEGGETPMREMVKGVERGLLVTRLHYVNGFLDTRRALMTGMTRDGTFLIEDGGLKGAVGNLRFTQSLIEALCDVRALSRERKLIPAWWSEASSTGGFTVPAIHLGKFRFTGRQERES